jgi:hypothetical protein
MCFTRRKRGTQHYFAGPDKNCSIAQLLNLKMKFRPTAIDHRPSTPIPEVKQYIYLAILIPD